MASVGGFFLKGLAGGLQWGTEMAWKKKQEKKLEEQQNKMIEAGTIFNTQLAEALEDKKITDEELNKITVLYFSGGFEFQEHYKSAFTHINNMHSGALEKEQKWMDDFIDMTSGYSPDDIPEMYDWGRKHFTSPKSKNYFEAYEATERRKAKPTAEVFMSAEALREKYPKAGVKFTDEGYVPIFGEPTEAPVKLTGIPAELAEIDKLTFLTEERRNQMKVDKLSKSDSATAEKVKAIKAAGGTNEDVLRALSGEAKVTGVAEPKPETVATLVKWEDMFDMKKEDGIKTEEEYNRALNLLAQSEDTYKPKYATWKEALIAEAKGIAKELKGITDKKDYKLLLGVYMQKLEEIKRKYPEVDLNQFPVFEEQKGLFQKFLDWGK